MVAIFGTSKRKCLMLTGTDVLPNGFCEVAFVSELSTGFVAFGV